MRVFRDSAASRVRAAAVLGVALVALAGCSSDDGSSAATTTSSAAAPSTSAKSSASSGASANATTSAQGAPNPGTEEATLDYTAATGVVLTEVPGGRITDLRFVVEKGGTYVWEADVLDASGVQRAVDVDAVSGRILQNVPR
ncbi:PepSY domain-containing protein [Rhodococcus sp. (in: high G+C Gram-positive bacteria)]|uniref:PepSY domain-containing protein n=1 Tax=Rhodococcus sp. TaxID=1831 RepID=UPI003B8A9941